MKGVINKLNKKEREQFFNIMPVIEDIAERMLSGHDNGIIKYKIVFK